MRSKKWRPITITPIESHMGFTYAAEVLETLIPSPSPEWSYSSSPPSVSGTSPLKYHSWRGPTSSFSSALKPSTETTLCMITVPTRFSSRRFCAWFDLVAFGDALACRKSIGRHRTVVWWELPVGGEPAPKSQVRRWGVPGEVLELLAEVGLVEVASVVCEFRPVDRTHGVDGEDQSCEAVDTPDAFRGDPDVRLELGGQMVAADPGAI